MHFVFHNPTKLVFGKGRIAEIGAEIRARGFSSVLLVCGGGSVKKNGVYAQVISSLKTNGVSWREVWGVQPNPSLEKVREIIQQVKCCQAEAILAVGGGSVIDASKAACAGYYLKDVWNAFEGSEDIKQALPLFTVLTISATASEMDPFAVITKEEEHKKWAVTSVLLNPVVSIVDPSVQHSLPWNQTVNGAVDGISHVLEAYICGKNQETTLSIDEALMRTIISCTDVLQKNGRNEPARENLCWALTLALNGTSEAGVGDGDWSSHSIEHALSALRPEIAHGAGLAVIFPAVIQYVQRANSSHLKRWARNVWGVDSVDKAVAKMKAKYKAWGAPTRLKELGVAEKEIPVIAALATKRGKIGSLKSLTKVDVEKILKLAF